MALGPRKKILSARLRCRTLLPGRHDERTAVCSCCSVKGRLHAVLLCLRYIDTYCCGYRKLVYAFVLYLKQAGSKQNKKSQKAERGGKKTVHAWPMDRSGKHNAPSANCREEDDRPNNCRGRPPKTPTMDNLVSPPTIVRFGDNEGIVQNLVDLNDERPGRDEEPLARMRRAVWGYTPTTYVLSRNRRRGLRSDEKSL